MEQEKHVCCICGKEFYGYGNNPDGAHWRNPETGEIETREFGPDERCCDECDQMYVIPGRLYLINKTRMNHEKK